MFIRNDLRNVLEPILIKKGEDMHWLPSPKKNLIDNWAGND